MAELDQVHKHPSYGMARFSRVQGGNYTLFGSSVQHNHTITLTICTGQRIRNLNMDWYHAGNELIEVVMSPVQFAELVSSLNCGSGIPCTIEHVGGERRPPCPDEHKRTEFHNEFKDSTKEVASQAASLLQKVNDVLNKKSLTKTDREEVREMMRQLIQQIDSNLPFVLKQFNEQVERTVVEAKGEIDAAMTHMIVRLGGEKLAELIGEGPQAQTLDLIEQSP